ncbi:hypothetical protein GGS20DRAFT_594327 [Poronia punctata]|nr:hypothetical protein GGS20DRAFT_594327 [Poronia punctata]
MRYEDWDVLLFRKDSKIPLKEFKTNCHVVQDSGMPHHSTDETRKFAYSHGSYGLPTMTCFMPGLPSGTPFSISLHTWKTPDISQFARTYTKYPEHVEFEARVLIDGRLVATSSFKRTGPWPQLISHSFEFTKNGDLEVLKFPQFRNELLRQSYWSPADDVGRIKIIISEGFARDSLTVPIERIKNVIAFSFQHAPLEILESSGIAWPNPAMWRRGPFNPTMPVPSQQHDDGPDAHIHSPRKRGKPTSGSLGGHLPAPNAPQMNPSSFLGSMASSQDHLQRGPGGMYVGYADPFNVNKTEASLYGWPGNAGIIGQTHVADMGKAKLSDRKGASRSKISSSDTSMPDYSSANSHGNHLMSEFRPLNFMTENEVDPGTSGLAQHPATDNQGALMEPSFMADFGMAMNKPATPGNTPSHADFFNATDPCFSSELATSLTHSLLNQPHPLPTQASNMAMPAAEIKSRKENVLNNEIPTEDTADMDHTKTRKVSHTVYTQAGNIGHSTDSATNSPPPHDTFAALFSHRALSGIEFGHDLTNSGLYYGNPNGESNMACESRAGNGSDKATKRTRQFTPASAKAIDDEDEPRRSGSRPRGGVGEADN